MTGACVSVEVEDGSVLVAAGRRCANPRGVGFGVAETVAVVVAFETAVSDEVLSLVSSGEGDLKIALTGVYGGGSVGGDEVL